MHLKLVMIFKLDMPSCGGVSVVIGAASDSHVQQLGCRNSVKGKREVDRGWGYA